MISKLTVVILFAVVLHGCMTTSSVHRYAGGGEKLVVIKTPVRTFQNSKGVGDEGAIGPWKTGDSLIASAYQSRGYGSATEYFYLVSNGVDSVWVSHLEVPTRDAAAARLMLSAEVPTTMSEEAWSRATVWINKYSDMKIQTASDNIISTYNPIKAGQYGYTVTRLVTKEKVTISIECNYKTQQYDLYGSSCLDNQRAAAYFISTGRSVVPNEIP